MLNEFDHQLMLWLNYDGGFFADTFWYTLTSVRSWVPFFIAILGTLAYSCRRERQPWLVYLGLLLFTGVIFAATDYISAGIIKPWVARPRPSHQEGVMEFLHYVGDYRGGAYGFVSSHAANCFGLAVWISLLFRNRALTVAMLTYAALNCYSRIYLGVHYPGDIICGTLLGVACAWLGYRGFVIAARRWSHPIRPASSPLPITLTFWISIAVMLLYALVA